MTSLSESFRDTPRTYRPQPFYFLNHRLTEDELRRQLHDMHPEGGRVLRGPHDLQPGGNEIVVEVANSLANLYAKDAERTSGLIERPRLIGLT